MVSACLVCPWAAARPLAVRAASFARRVVSKPGQALPPPTDIAARPRRPRSGLRSGGADPVSVRLSRRSRTSQPGPAGLAAASDRVALILFRLGSAAAHGHRSGSRRPRSGLRSGGADPVSVRLSRRPRTSQRVPQASQRPLIGRSDEHSPAPPQPTNSGIREVPTQFVWCRAQWRRQLNPAQKRIRTGPLLLALRRQRVSSLLGQCTRRSTPRRRWGGSNQAGWPGADST